MALEIRRVDAGTPIARSLIAESSEDQVQRYGRDGGLGVEQLSGDDVVFVVAFVDGRAAGCGAVVPLASGIGELSRIFVRSSARRRGVGAAILDWIENHVRDRYERLRLETGSHQPESILLYEAQGYERIDCWAKGDPNPLSRCYEKRLSRSPN